MYQSYILLHITTVETMSMNRTVVWVAGSPNSIEILPILSQRFGIFLRKSVAGIPDFAFEGPLDF
jgi:hypothetical protein